MRWQLRPVHAGVLCSSEDLIMAAADAPSSPFLLIGFRYGTQFDVADNTGFAVACYTWLSAATCLSAQQPTQARNSHTSTCTEQNNAV